MLTAEKLVALHEEYRRACEGARDDNASPEARKNAADVMMAKRHELDAALIEDRIDRDDKEREAQVTEARARAAKLVGGLPPIVESPFPLEAIRAYGNSKKPKETLSFLIPFEAKAPIKAADWTTSDTTTYSTYTVPQTWQRDVYMFQVAQSGVLAAGPTILPTTNGNQINYPKLTTDMSSLAGTEGGAATETNPVFGTLPLNSYRVDGWTPIADELFRDSGVDIEAVLRRLAARSLAVKAAPYYGDIDIGTGTSLPNAITVGITNGKTSASQTAPTLDEIKECMMSVLPAYRIPGRFIANTTLTLAVALMKDGDGAYIREWQPSPAPGQPDRLFGKPWFEDAYFDASAQGNIPLVFGDIEAAYIVRRIGGIQVDLSRDFAFTSFETTARWAMYHDAGTIDTIACKALTLA
jgi:HK97 family phage major capsid protein